MAIELLPAASLVALMAEFPCLRRKGLLRSVVGISGKAVKGRVAKNPEATLTLEENQRTRQLSEIFFQATRVMGAEATADTWMCKNAIGLNNQVPLVLMTTQKGADAIRVYLMRLEHGVYC